MVDVGQALSRVRNRIAAAAQRVGRQPAGVALVGVTKGVEAARIQAALAAGLTDVGENRIQEAAPKIDAVGRRAARWHMVGHLQRNKVRDAVTLFDVIQSVDSLRLAADLSRRATAPIEILLQVNIAGESQKFGLVPDDLEPATRRIAILPRLHLTGLMTIAPMAKEPETVRPVFRRLRELRDRLNDLRIPGITLQHLSMGMSDDFEVAIEEGATIVRIGRAIFGERA